MSMSMRSRFYRNVDGNGNVDGHFGKIYENRGNSWKLFKLVNETLIVV